METIREPLAEFGVAQLALSRQGDCGDVHVVRMSDKQILAAAIDGIGHGEEAALAAKLAAAILESNMGKPILSAVQECHERLKWTRGVVLSAASIDVEHGMMTWIGIGNVQGVLMREGSPKGTGQEHLLLRPGVIGSQLPALQAAVIPVWRGDTLAFATDGIRAEFVDGISHLDSPQRAAEKTLERYSRANDDALALVVRLTGI